MIHHISFPLMALTIASDADRIRIAINHSIVEQNEIRDRLWKIGLKYDFNPRFDFMENSKIPEIVGFLTNRTSL
jgi:hypothetical protein